MYFINALAIGCARSISHQNATQKFLGQAIGHCWNAVMMDSPCMTYLIDGPMMVMQADIMSTHAMMLNVILA